MEGLAVSPGFWEGKRVLLTGHTGFKGSWLSIWLQSIGAEVVGFALPPPAGPSLFETAKVDEKMVSILGDIRDLGSLQEVFRRHRPEIVIHMAAQPLVRYSYKNPVETFFTNVMGTVHILEAVRSSTGVKVVVNVTTDKCYENKEWIWGYRESDRLGGSDPYSNSKACSELVSNSYRDSFLKEMGISLGTARGGNVIGGGDWAADRLVPDVLHSLEKNQSVIIRSPSATRPWQHVLESLCGYLTLAEKLYTDGEDYAQAWNFGPADDSSRTVQWVVEYLVKQWGSGTTWKLDSAEHPHEANYLKLDVSKTKNFLGWRHRWNIEMALHSVVEWHQDWLAGMDMREVVLSQINQYQLSSPPG